MEAFLAFSEHKSTYLPAHEKHLTSKCFIMLALEEQLKLNEHQLIHID